MYNKNNAVGTGMGFIHAVASSFRIYYSSMTDLKINRDVPFYLASETSIVMDEQTFYRFSTLHTSFFVLTNHSSLKIRDTHFRNVNSNGNVFSVTNQSVINCPYATFYDINCTNANGSAIYIDNGEEYCEEQLTNITNTTFQYCRNKGLSGGAIFIRSRADNPFLIYDNNFTTCTATVNESNAAPDVFANVLAPSNRFYVESESASVPQPFEAYSKGGAIYWYMHPGVEGPLQFSFSTLNFSNCVADRGNLIYINGTAFDTTLPPEAFDNPKSTIDPNDYW